MTKTPCKGESRMSRKAICSVCRTGKETFLLDRRAPECPYLACFGKGGCPFYRRLEKADEVRKNTARGNDNPPVSIFRARKTLTKHGKNGILIP